MNSEIMKEIYNQYYSMTDENIADHTLNSIGWNSSFTGKPYTPEEMSEWRNNTIDILASLTPRRVLECACGTGMMMFKIIDDLDYYLGVDVAEEGIKYIKKHMNDRQIEKTDFYVMPAENIDKLEQEGFDLAFINSATQYMGGEDEFTGCFKKMIDKVGYGGKIFLGDIKSSSLRDMFYKTVELWNNDASDIEKRIERRKKYDFEFYISSEYLYSLQNTIPRIKHIDIMLKKGEFPTEMNLFRFDAIFYLDEYKETDHTEIDCKDLGLDEIEERIASAGADDLKLTSISNRLLMDIAEKKLGYSSSGKISHTIKAVCSIAEKHSYKAVAVPHGDDCSEKFDVLASKIS